ncbi:MAG: glucose-6-phosphate dehydrogenase assembly protein OpcA [Thermomicrobiales bacterium]
MTRRYMAAGHTGGAQAVVDAPSVSTTWESQELDTVRVEREIERLWVEMTAQRDLQRPQRIAADGDVGLMRASTLNLVVTVEKHDDADEVERIISQLSELTPSRAIILVRTPVKDDEPSLMIRLSVHQHEASKLRPGIQFECLTVGVKGEPSTSLASVASSLLVPELPTFLWWCGTSLPMTALFMELSEISDRLLIDSATIDRRGRTLIELSNLIHRSKIGPKASDFAWTRLLPWRQAVAQFFESVSAQQSLETIDEVVIGYERNRSERVSGLASALLIAGWIATRLEWQAPGELVRTHDGWRVTLRAGRAGRRREVILRLRPEDEALDACLAKLSMAAVSPHAGMYFIERVGPHTLMTRSETTDAPVVSRAIYLHAQDIATLLEHELRHFGRDLVFEESLQFAASLVPEGELD